MKRLRMATKLKIATLLALCLIAVVAVSMKPSADTAFNDDRAPSSVDSDKWAVLQPLDGTRPVLGKRTNPIAIEALPSSRVEMVPGDAFTLSARITARREYDRLEWRWTLPEGVELISGELNSEKSGVARGEEIEVTIRLMTPYAQSQLAFLHAFEVVNGEPSGNSLQFQLVPTLEPDAPGSAESAEAAELPGGEPESGLPAVMQ